MMDSANNGRKIWLWLEKCDFVGSLERENKIKIKIQLIKEKFTFKTSCIFYLWYKSDSMRDSGFWDHLGWKSWRKKKRKKEMGKDNVKYSERGSIIYLLNYFVQLLAFLLHIYLVVADFTFVFYSILFSLFF